MTCVLVVMRRQWFALPQAELFNRVYSLVLAWEPVRLVVDATGIGAGLASFLERAFPGRVLPFTFSVSSKSSLGWNFIALVESGRYQEHAPSRDPEAARLQDIFYAQAQACRMELLPGAGKRLRWEVPASARHPRDGSLLHDDLLVSAAMSTLLETLIQDGSESLVLHPASPLDGLGEVY
jgi:hypothetical protein